jgi:hypothetical protein
VHVPAADARTWCELINCRGPVIAKRTRAKNCLRTLLRCAGVVPPSRSNLWTKKGLEWLRRLKLSAESQRLSKGSGVVFSVFRARKHGRGLYGFGPTVPQQAP